MSHPQPFYFSILFYQLSLSAAKISICLTYLRIFVAQHLRLACWIMLGIVGVTCTWISMSAIFLCFPPAAFWDKSIDGHCMNKLIVWFTNAGLNIATDFALLILPMPMLSHLQLPRKQKIGLIVVFSLGGL